MKVIGSHGQKIKRRTNVRRKRNPVSAREVNEAGTDYAKAVQWYGEAGAWRALEKYQALVAKWEKQTGRTWPPTKSGKRGEGHTQLLASVRAAHRKNPRGTRVARCVRDVKRSNAARRRAHRKTVRSPMAVCQAATGQSYASGRRLAKGRGAKGLRANPLPIRVGFKEGPPVALFRSLPRARQYAQALADHSGRQVRVQG